MTKQFNPPPNWPAPPEGWKPPEGWTPDPAWGPAPEGWQLWTGEDATTTPSDPDVLWEGKGQPIKGFGAGRYKLTKLYLFFERGALRTDAQQVPIAQVMDVDVVQSMTQKARGLGTVRVHIQRSTGIEVVPIEDIAEPRKVQQLINDTAHQAGAVLLQNQNTMRYSQQAPPPVGAAVAPAEAAPASAAADPMEQLRKLAELRDAGILTQEEFDAKKTDILSRM